MIFIEDMPGLYAETFIVADKKRFISEGHNVEHLYLSEFKFSFFNFLVSVLLRPLMTIKVLYYLSKGMLNFRRFLSNLHCLSLFLSNYSFLQDKLKDVNLRCHFLAKRFSFGFFCNLYFGVPYSGVAHAKDIFEWDNSIQAKIYFSDYVDCISNYNIGYLNAKCSFKYSHKLRLYRNSILISPPSDLKRNIVDSKNNSVKFISICRFVEKKGLFQTLHFLELLSDYINIEWEVIGDGPLYEKFYHTVKKSKISKFVTLFGVKSQDFIANNLLKADYFILLVLNGTPKKLDTDGIPTVFMESLYYGVPVITTCVSGIPELIINGVNGVLFQTNMSDDENIKLFLSSHCVGFKKDDIDKSLEFFKNSGC